MENSTMKIDNIPRKASRMFEKFYAMLYMFIKFLKRFKKHLCNKIILQYLYSINIKYRGGRDFNKILMMITFRKLIFLNGKEINIPK